MTKRVRVAVVNSHPIQYFVPLYRALSQEPWIDLTVFYASRGPLIGTFDDGFGRPVEWDIPLLEGYRHEFVVPVEKDRGPHAQVFASGFARRILAGEFDLVWTHGYNTKLAATAIVAAMLGGVRRAVRGDTHLGKRRSKLRSVGRWMFLRPLYRTFDAVLSIGARNREFYEWCGVRESRMFLVPYVVDNAFFRRTAESRAEGRRAVREKLGIAADDVVIAFASKLVPGKRAVDLLAAFERVRKANCRAVVVIAGSGIEEDRLMSFVATRQMTGVVFAGFWNQSELPALFSAADIFVLPSDNEAWGLVVNEAMCASLPIIVSAAVGCWPDLVVPGVNGFVHAVGDIDALSTYLLELVNDAQVRGRMGAASAEIISGWGIREAVTGLRKACAALFPDSIANIS